MNEDFFITSIPSRIPCDNGVTLYVYDHGHRSYLEFPGPNGKLDADIAFRRLWAEEVEGIAST